MIVFNDRLAIRPMKAGQCDVCGDDAYTFCWELTSEGERAGIFCSKHMHPALSKYELETGNG